MAFLPSLTGLACLAGFALIIRMLRRSQSESEEGESGSRRVNRCGKLSRSALALLIEKDPVPYLIVDVRERGSVARSPAPQILKNGPGPYITVPVSDIRRVFYRRSSGEFSSTFPGVNFPSKDTVLVFVSDDVEQSQKGVEEAQALGFLCSVYLDDSIGSLRVPPKSYPPVKFLSRHAVAVLVKTADNFSPVEACVVDLRRNDEHVAFGSIDGMKNLPAAEAPRALQMDKSEFFEKYQFPKPTEDEVVVFSCRTNKRASWVSLLWTQAGFKNVYVHHTGAYGWHFNSNVKKYESYEWGEGFPEPIPFTVERPDRNAGLRELSEVGLTTGGRRDVH